MRVDTFIRPTTGSFFISSTFSRLSLPDFRSSRTSARLMRAAFAFSKAA